MLVTTAKDHVRLSPEMKPTVTVFNVDIKWQNTSAFVDFITQSIESKKAHA